MVEQRHIDINCDLGEGLNNEAFLMPMLSSCNIACGGHAGDEATMVAVIQLAKRFNVKIGAHPSFPDKENFGRTVMDLSESDLNNALRTQILALKEIATRHDVALHHIKPHGALYNLAAKDTKTANVIIDVMLDMDPNLILYVPYGSIIEEAANQRGVKVMKEGFADRNYNEDLTLVSRQKSDAIIHGKQDIFEHVYKMINEQKIVSKSGVEVEVKIDTICVHGDHKNVVENLKFLTQKLKENFIQIL